MFFTLVLPPFSWMSSLARSSRFAGSLFRSRLCYDRFLRAKNRKEFPAPSATRKKKRNDARQHRALRYVSAYGASPRAKVVARVAYICCSHGEHGGDDRQYCGFESCVPLVVIVRASSSRRSRSWSPLRRPREPFVARDHNRFKEPIVISHFCRIARLASRSLRRRWHRSSTQVSSAR